MFHSVQSAVSRELRGGAEFRYNEDVDTDKLSDRGYKALFSHPQMVEELLRSFVHEDFLDEIDFSALRRENQTFVTEDLRQRETDVIWALRVRGRPAYVYLLLEFQSSVDRFMAVRVLNYVTLLYQDLLKSGRSRQLPPVFPLVLYTGSDPWTAPLELRDLVDLPNNSLVRYVPEFRYVLIAENQFARESLLELRNLVAGVFLIETCDAESIVETITRVREILDREAGPDLRRVFTTWVQRSLQRDGIDVDASVLDSLEVSEMLETTMKKYRETLLSQGWAAGRTEGKAEGKAEGRAEGIRASIALLAESRFGEEAHGLDEWLAGVSDPRQLQAILVRVSTATSLAEVREALD